MSTPDQIAAKGSWGQVEWAADARGRLPAKEYFDSSLADRDQAKVLALFKLMADRGKVTNQEKFKRIEGTELFEFKSFQVRFLGDFRPGKRFLVAHGLRKQRDRLNPTEIASAIRVLVESDQREGEA